MDCLSNSSGHGLPQIFTPGNLFLRLVWTVFFFIALCGGLFMIYQMIEQFMKYEVITMTKIIREIEMTMPAITICSQGNVQEMIIECKYEEQKCTADYLTLYSDYSYKRYCVQLNFGTNHSALNKQLREGNENGYKIMLYNPFNRVVQFAVTDNRAQVIYEDVKELVNIYIFA